MGLKSGLGSVKKKKTLAPAGSITMVIYKHSLSRYEVKCHVLASLFVTVRRTRDEAVAAGSMDGAVTLTPSKVSLAPGRAL